MHDHGENPGDQCEDQRDGKDHRPRGDVPDGGMAAAQQRHQQGGDLDQQQHDCGDGEQHGPGDSEEEGNRDHHGEDRGRRKDREMHDHGTVTWTNKWIAVCAASGVDKGGWG